jgi:hypothetical protein
VRQFRSLLHGSGIAVKGGLFPVQTPLIADAAAVHARLEAKGIRTVLHQARKNRPAQLSFLITAEHEPWEIEQAACSLTEIVHHLANN